jgi:hypothetical protein
MDGEITQTRGHSVKIIGRSEVPFLPYLFYYCTCNIIVLYVIIYYIIFYSVLILFPRRANMIYGYTVPKELCAFSQPTADGKLFFESYRGTKEFLVYL